MAGKKSREIVELSENYDSWGWLLQSRGVACVLMIWFWKIHEAIVERAKRFLATSPSATAGISFPCPTWRKCAGHQQHITVNQKELDVLKHAHKSCTYLDNKNTRKYVEFSKKCSKIPKQGKKNKTNKKYKLFKNHFHGIQNTKEMMQRQMVTFA